MRYAVLFLASTLAMAGCSSSDDGTGSNTGGGADPDPGTDPGTDPGSNPGTDPDPGTDPNPGAVLLIDANSYEAILREAVAAVSLTSLERDAEKVNEPARELYEIGRTVRADESSSSGLTFVSDESIDARFAILDHNRLL